MTRTRYLVWPVLALAASFALVFGVTFVAGSTARVEKPVVTPTVTVTATPPPVPGTTEGTVIRVDPTQLTVSVLGRPAGAGQGAPEPVPVAMPVLERDGDFVCLTGDLQAWGWKPAEPWEQHGTRLCRQVPAGQTLELRFVPA